MTLAIDSILKPLFEAGGKYHGKVKAIIRLQVQPWHTTSTLVHEAAIAAARAAPAKFWDFHLALMKNQKDYFDIPSSQRTTIETREKLAELAAPIIGHDNVGVFKDLLKYKSTPNGGNGVTDDLKYTIKFSRQNGIHVSPTVLWDGLISGEISSSWGEKEWISYLESKVVV